MIQSLKSRIIYPNKSFNISEVPVRRSKTFVLLALTVIVLLASLFVVSNVQYSLHGIMWTIFQIKYLIYGTLGIIVGLIIGFYTGVIYTLRKQNKENK